MEAGWFNPSTIIPQPPPGKDRSEVLLVPLERWDDALLVMRPRHLEPTERCSGGSRR